MWDAATLPPVYEAKPSFATGALALGGPVRPTHLVRSTSAADFAPQGTAVAENGTLTLYRLVGGPSLAWISRGIDNDGWTDARTRTQIRVFGGDRARVWTLRLLAKGRAEKDQQVDVSFGRSQESVRISDTAELKVTACVPAGEPKMAIVRPHGSSPLDDRRVGIRVLEVKARPTARLC